MEAEKEASTYISLEDIGNFPFPYKLWLTVNSETCEFSKWNIDGTELELRIVSLDNYLSSSKSIFKIKNRSAFIDHLRCYGFEVLKSDSLGSESAHKEEGTPANPGQTYSEIMISFKHEHFQRHRIDLLAKIRRVNDSGPEEMRESDKKGILMAERMEGDLCFTSFGTLSKIQKSRIRYQTILNLQSETRILQEKLLASELRSKSRTQEEDAEDVMIELPADLFENPHDSVLYMGDEHRTAYAGFYGNCSKEQIVKFFGDYLPMYENVDDDESERRIVDLNPSGRVASAQFEMDYPMSAETTQLDDFSQDHSPPPTASSSLQPIFLADDEEEDISMDEFIKFKEQTSDTAQEPTAPTEEFKTKVETVNDEEDNENEANFKNFFSQYRESLSLLYEKQ